MANDSPVAAATTSAASAASAMSSKNVEKCQRAATFYQSKFKSHGVTPIAARDLVSLLLQQQQRDKKDATTPAVANETLSPAVLSLKHLLEDSENSSTTLTLVDVRTKAERAVSMIQGAISLDEYYALRRRQEDDAAVATATGSSTSPPPPNKTDIVVCYCTIGYRSGMESVRLRQVFGHDDNDKLSGRGASSDLYVYNLDGIVAMSHALAMLPQQSAADNNASATTESSSKAVVPPFTRLIQPSTGQATLVVHTFSSLWDWVALLDVDRSHFTSTYFSTLETMGRLLQVLVRIVVRKTQTIWYALRRCGSRMRRKRPTAP